MRLVLFVYQPSGSWDIQRRQFRVVAREAENVGYALGQSVLLCERQNQHLGYFAIGRLSAHAVTGRDVTEHVLTVADVAYFDRAVMVENTGGSAVFALDARTDMAPDDRVGRITEAEFDRLASAGGLLPDATASRRMVLDGFADDQRAFWNEDYSGIVAHGNSEALSARAIRAYRQSCAVSGLTIRNRQGSRCEAVAVPIGAGSARAKTPTQVSDMICLNRTWAYLYEQGLMAIAGDFSICVKDGLIPDIVLAQLPGDGRIRVPEDPADWPDSDALAAHCGTYFG
ncbi:hypothetical protein [Pelagibacterium xiamenense]|uniref:hypothetical protein n=1 Tax=Pelagibacterium xiamenense TaxID=2901140 RepID=UPI001E413852|nr:hypothetical protein [Pelagibacterium xiamenense]MCD7061476.1 hypothetical protein [Pelagibacterium xiamenense]